MIDKNMLKLAEIRNSYSLKRYGYLTLEQSALLGYDKLCLNLIKENQKCKEAIYKATSYVEQHAITVTDGIITTNKHELLEILKEVE